MTANRKTERRGECPVRIFIDNHEEGVHSMMHIYYDISDSHARILDELTHLFKLKGFETALVLQFLEPKNRLQCWETRMGSEWKDIPKKVFDAVRTHFNDDDRLTDFLSQSSSHHSSYVLCDFPPLEFGSAVFYSVSSFD